MVFKAEEGRSISCGLPAERFEYVEELLFSVFIHPDLRSGCPEDEITGGGEEADLSIMSAGVDRETIREN